MGWARDYIVVYNALSTQYFTTFAQTNTQSEKHQKKKQMAKAAANNLCVCVGEGGDRHKKEKYELKYKHFYLEPETI